MFCIMFCEEDTRQTVLQWRNDAVTNYEIGDEFIASVVCLCGQMLIGISVGKKLDD
jgi:hypothetical protein